ncbi:MAG: thioesterase family protein [Hyphomicrobiaceae bacterium]|nr:acyl-CoA thioesterase [Hyphomicrobiaceae bacterium]
MSGAVAIERRPPARRSEFGYFIDITTRWMDNDVYGHVNNVVYYAYIDTVINRYLIDVGGLEIHTAPVIGITPETSCRFHRAFAYPDKIEGGLRVVRLGAKSATYEVGLFGPGETDARADGLFTHVFVARATHRPVAIPETLRAALARLA